MSGFFSFGFRQAHAADLRLTIRAAGNVVLVDRFVGLAGNARYRDDAAHGPDVRELRHTSDDIANGVDSLFAGLHPFIGVNKATLHFDPRRFLQADAFSVRPAADGDEDFFGFQLLRGFTVRREAYGYASFRLVNFFYLGVDEAVDAFLFE